MGWIQTLVETYDKCVGEVGKQTRNDQGQLVVLLPIAHSIYNADVEIMLDESANVIDVRKLTKEEQQTIIPVTEDSAVRSSNIAPMPLSDNISYLAGDFKNYSNDTKKKCRYDSYIIELEKWANEKDAHSDIKIIYNYLKKGKLIKDLLKAEIFSSINELLELKGVIRFKVKYSDADLVVGSYDKLEIFINYINYYYKSFANRKKQIDYICGKNDYITEKLPSKIRSTSDGARLISSNDTNTNIYTYKGRFVLQEESVTISYEMSQKAHNALRWLIQKQGYRNGSEVIVIFGVDTETKIKNPLEEDFLIPLSSEIDTSEEFAKHVKGVLNGWYPLNPAKREKVVVMALDTADGATQGRLAITYYNEFEKSEFKENLEKWYSECVWILKNKDQYFEGTPKLRDIVNVAYGVQGADKYLKINNENFSKKIINRLLPCIVQHKKIPKDLIVAAVNNLNNAMSTDDNLFDKKIRVTCALIKKYYIDYKKEVIEMALDKTKNDRSYLFGRLLALTDGIENYAIYKEGSGRETNAKRYWSIYKRKPASTYELLREKIQPYLNRLYNGITNKYDIEVSQIMKMLSENNDYNNSQLNEQYILGYYLQMDELKNNNKKTNEMEGNENE